MNLTKREIPQRYQYTVELNEDEMLHVRQTLSYFQYKELDKYNMDSTMHERLFKHIRDSTEELDEQFNKLKNGT